MPGRRKRSNRGDGPIEVYRQVRKPMPPPERVIPDRRRERAERLAEREAVEEPTDEEKP